MQAYLKGIPMRVIQNEAAHPQSERSPAPAADAQEEEVGNLLLQMDEEEQRAGCDLVSSPAGAARPERKSALADARQTTHAQQELPDPATAAAKLLAKFHRPSGLRIGERK